MYVMYVKERILTFMNQNKQSGKNTKNSKPEKNQKTSNKQKLIILLVVVISFSLLVIVSAVVAVALAVVLSIVFILGADLLKNFALTAIIGVAVTYLLTLFVLPAFLKK